MLLQALAGHVLGAKQPKDYRDFLLQRVETNYLAAALMVPEDDAVAFLTEAKDKRELSVEDLRDAFAVSYETAAHRFTNLATQHLGIPVHFLKVHESGTISKAYENDNAAFPTDVLGAVEGQLVCRKWSARRVFDAEDRFSPFHQYTDKPNGTYWCTSSIQSTAQGAFSVSVGTPFSHVKWFRGRDTANRQTSTCPDESCCRSAPADLAATWEGKAFPSARMQSSLLAAMPAGVYPGWTRPRCTNSSRRTRRASPVLRRDLRPSARVFSGNTHETANVAAVSRGLWIVRARQCLDRAESRHDPPPAAPRGIRRCPVYGTLRPAGRSERWPFARIRPRPTVPWRSRRGRTAGRTAVAMRRLPTGDASPTRVQPRDRAELYGLPLPLYAQTADTLHVSSPAPLRAPAGAGITGHQISDAVWSSREFIRYGPLGMMFVFQLASPELVWAQLAPRLLVDDLVAVGDADRRWPAHLSAPSRTCTASPATTPVIAAP